MPDSRFRFGEPPRDDVDAAAQLLVRYQDAGLMSPELGQMFAMLVDDFRAVIRRANELRREDR
jgi:hypothetical protein